MGVSVSDIKPLGCGVADFEVLSALGKGAFACVQKVACKKTGVILAMKTISKDLIAKRGMEEQVQLEIATHQRLQHRNIVRMHMYLEDQTSVHMLLEHAGEGQLLELLQRQGNLAHTEAAKIFADVLSALMYLHARDIAHRDVKAENVLLCSGHVAKLADFGWCVELPKGQTSCAFCGTVDYLSPEVVVREPYDTRVDVWAAGVLLFVMLVGKLPFAAKTLAEKFERIRKVEFVLPAQLSTAACDVIGGLLQRHPSDRMLLSTASRHDFVRDSGSGTGVSRDAIDCSTDGGESAVSVDLSLDTSWTKSVTVMSNSDASQIAPSTDSSASSSVTSLHQDKVPPSFDIGWSCDKGCPPPKKSPQRPMAHHGFTLDLKGLDAKLGTEQLQLHGSKGMPPFTDRGKLQTDPFATLRSWINAQKAEAEEVSCMQHNSSSQPALVQLAQEI